LAELWQLKKENRKACQLGSPHVLTVVPLCFRQGDQKSTQAYAVSANSKLQSSNTKLQGNSKHQASSAGRLVVCDFPGAWSFVLGAFLIPVCWAQRFQLP